MYRFVALFLIAIIIAAPRGARAQSADASSLGNYCVMEPPDDTASSSALGNYAVLEPPDDTASSSGINSYAVLRAKLPTVMIISE